MVRKAIAAVVGLALLAPHGFAADVSKARQVRLVFNDHGQRWVTGDAVPADRIITILFVEEPCPLRIVGRATMYRAWAATGAYQLGCWYPTIDGNYVFVGQLASLTYASGAPWEMLPRAELHPDGSATITERDYNSETFVAAVLNRRALQLFENTQQKP